LEKTMQTRIGIAALVLAALVGCGTQSAPPSPPSTSTPEPPAAAPAAEAAPSEGAATDTANTTLVTLKLPGMT
jgi:hypothetical protein